MNSFFLKFNALCTLTRQCSTDWLCDLPDRCPGTFGSCRSQPSCFKNASQNSWTWKSFNLKSATRLLFYTWKYRGSKSELTANTFYSGANREINLLPWEPEVLSAKMNFQVYSYGLMVPNYETGRGGKVCTLSKIFCCELASKRL